MVAYKRDEIISVTELARNLSDTLNSITKKQKDKIAISKNNRLEAVIIDIDEYEKLKEVYELIENAEIAEILKERVKTPKDKYISLEESAKALGIDLDEL